MKRMEYYCFFLADVLHACTNKSRKNVFTGRISAHVDSRVRAIDKFRSRFSRQLVQIIKITRLTWCLQKRPAYRRSNTMTV